MIHFYDLITLNAKYKAQFLEAVSRVIDSGTYMIGKETKTFEDNFKKYCGVDCCIGVGNGLDALTLTLCAYKELGIIKNGDEVIVPATSFPTTVAPLVQNRLIPVFVDCGLADYNLDINQVRAAISSRTRAIMFAHTLGNPADMDAIMKIV